MKSYIAFDYLAVQPSLFSPFHGGGKYGKIILNEILTRTDKVVLFYSEKNRHEGLDEIKSKYPSIVLANIDFPETWDNVFSVYSISCLYLPIPFSRLYKLYSTRFPENLRVVGTIHGLRNLEAFPSLESFCYKVPIKGFIKTVLEFLKTRLPGYEIRRQKEWGGLIKSSNYEYFVVSNHTLSAVKKFMPEQNPNVFYSPSVISNVCKKIDKKPYFLLVSGNRWEKNNLRVMRVLDRMFSNSQLPSDFFVKITGVKNLDCFRYTFKNPSKFECVGYVEENLFSELYANAYALIYPSLSEGFGYPILESLVVGTPVVASKLTSIPEVGGDAVAYFDPISERDIETQIVRILNKDVYQSIQIKAKEQYTKILNRQKEDLKKAVDFIMKRTL